MRTAVPDLVESEAGLMYKMALLPTVLTPRWPLLAAVEPLLASLT